MLFVASLRARNGSPQETIARRAQWQYPEGVRVVGEYWLQGDPTVLSIIEADSVAPIMAITTQWADAFDITVLPAVTAEEGLALAKQMMEG
jgi:hypothetical protein